MHTPSKPRRQAFLAVALAPTVSILFISLLANAQSSGYPESSSVDVKQISDLTFWDDKSSYSYFLVSSGSSPWWVRRVTPDMAGLVVGESRESNDSGST